MTSLFAYALAETIAGPPKMQGRIMSQEKDVSSSSETRAWMLPLEAAAQRGMRKASLEFPADIDADRGSLLLGDA